LGLAAKVRPCLVLSVPTDGEERALLTLVPHTTSVRGTQYEVVVNKHFLKSGAFDAQGLVTVAPARLIRRLGELNTSELRLVEDAVKQWLGF
jgi:mRNA interferase MazF